MDQSQSTSTEPGGMQFDQAELASDAAGSFDCAFCKRPLVSSYFDINGKPACEACRYKLEAEMAAHGMGGFFKAAFAGAGAAVLGAVLYFAVRALTGYEIGIVAIVVGFLVGRAVRWGSKGRGGWVYQTVAVVLTYLAIVSTYIPILVQEFAKEHPPAVTQAATGSAPAQAGGAPAPGGKEAAHIGVGDVILALGALLLFAAAVPFLAGLENIVGIFIIAIGLYEAWRINKRMVIDVTGPFAVGKLAMQRPAPEIVV